MGVDSTHPLHDEHLVEWEQMRDTSKGERIVKEKGFVYLPATAGMIQDGAETNNTESPGWKAYNAYRKRAVYPEMVKDGIEAMLGMMHGKPPTIELPEAMEPMRVRATLRNESLEMLLRRINEEQLKMGRLGIMGDVIDSGSRAGEPFIVTYDAEDIRNWDEGQLSKEASDGATDSDPQNLNFVSLDESGYERDAEFEWTYAKKYRVLMLGDPLLNEAEGEGTYRSGLFRDGSNSFSEAGLEDAHIKGNVLDEIPFVFINTKDIVPEPDEPPLLGLSNLTLAIYRGEADYRQALFMQGQDTLVIIGSVEEKQHRVGSGAAINIPSTGGDAKFIGVDSLGLPEMRSSLENDYRRADAKAGQMMMQPQHYDAESGEALKVRVGARTATLNQIAIAGAFGLEELLKKIARWMKLDDSKVSVIPNLDFVDDEMSGQELSEMMGAKVLGAPLSLESIHARMAAKGMTEKTMDEEMAAISNETVLSYESTSEDGPAGDPSSGGDE